MDSKLHRYLGVSEILFLLDVGEELSIALILLEDQQFRRHLASFHTLDGYGEAGSFIEVVDLIDRLNDDLRLFDLAEE